MFSLTLACALSEHVLKVRLYWRDFFAKTKNFFDLLNINTQLGNLQVISLSPSLSLWYQWTLTEECPFGSSPGFYDKPGATFSIPYGTMTVTYPSLLNNSSRQCPGKSITFILSRSRLMRLEGSCSIHTRRASLNVCSFTELHVV